MSHNRTNTATLILFLILDAALAVASQISQHLLWAILLAIALWLTLASLFQIVKGILEKCRLKPLVIRLAIGLLGMIESIALLFGVFYFAQDAVLFHPGHDPKSLDYITAKSDFDAVEIILGENTWNGILRNPASDDPSPLIIFFYGNAQNSAQTMRQMESFNIWPYFLDYQCLIMDYAGYGLNDGRSSLRNMCEEALAVFDYASSLPNVSHIIVGGYSIGTGPAIYLAANREADGLFLLAPYANTYDLYNNTLPIFYGPLRLFVKHKLAADKYAKAVSVPALVVSSRDDEIIPFDSSERLSECLGEECTFVAMSGIGHNSILFNREVLSGVKSYLGKMNFK